MRASSPSRPLFPTQTERSSARWAGAGRASRRRCHTLTGRGPSVRLFPSCPQAAILQQTAEYIFSLEQEKTRLLQQNTQLKRFIQVPDGESSRQYPAFLFCVAITYFIILGRLSVLSYPRNLPTSCLGLFLHL